MSHDQLLVFSHNAHYRVITIAFTVTDDLYVDTEGGSVAGKLRGTPIVFSSQNLNIIECFSQIYRTDMEFQLTISIKKMNIMDTYIWDSPKTSNQHS